MEPEKLIGKKVEGFKFASNKKMSYIDSMNSYVGKLKNPPPQNRFLATNRTK